MPQFLLLLRNEGHEDWSAADLQSVLKRYGTWSDGLRDAGKMAGGNKLRDREGKVLRRNGKGVTVMDGPFAESKEVLGGYFVVNADSYDDAVKLTKDCPHFEFGSIEVRQIEEMRPPA